MPRGLTPRHGLAAWGRRRDRPRRVRRGGRRRARRTDEAPVV